MKIFNNTIVCKSVKEKNLDPSGLIIPKQKNYKILEIINFDPNINTNLEDKIKVGDIAYVMLNAPFELDIEGEQYEIIKIDHIIMIP